MTLDLIWIVPVAVGVALAAYLGITDFARTGRDVEDASKD